ncbi:MAG: nucleotide exchange factor GrpE [Clostridia bacterium]|nr:nucleotide exchange factor GrpE [Clostridia bacterium]
MAKKMSEKEIAQEQESEDQMIRMFKDDFDAMQQEADKLAEDNAALVAENEKLKTLAGEMTGQAQRLQAEFDNYRKRTNETNKRVRIDGSVDVLEKMLPVLDAIEQARLMIKDESTLSGIAIIQRQLDSLLENFDVKMFDSLGFDFDPNLHNAIMEEDAPQESKGKVVRVYQQGYTIGGKILRHAVVIVGK